MKGLLVEKAQIEGQLKAALKAFVDPLETLPGMAGYFAAFTRAAMDFRSALAR